MTARALLAEAAQQGVRLYRVGDRIRYRADRPPPTALLERLRRHREELRPLLPEADDWRRDLATWSLPRHCRWSARAACLETFHGLSAAEADERAYREVSQEPELGTEVMVHAGQPGHFALAFEVEPPGAVSLAEALAARTVANER